MGDVHSEQGICLECHRPIDFKWRDEGQRVLGVGTTHIVAVEPDGKDPAVRWLTLQAKCRCGATLGWLVEHGPPFTAAADRSAQAPTDTGLATAAEGAAPPPRGA